VTHLRRRTVSITSKWFGDALSITPRVKGDKTLPPLSWPTISKFRDVMSMVYKHAQRHKLIPVTLESNPLRRRSLVEPGAKAIQVMRRRSRRMIRSWRFLQSWTRLRLGSIGPWFWFVQRLLFGLMNVSVFAGAT
jgi:hypothetical protein